MRYGKPALTSSVCLLLFAAACLSLAAFVKPNFSGTWELDQSRSHSIPLTMKQSMTVVHDGDTVSMETKITDARGERTLKDSYTLDGKRNEFTPPPPPQAPAGATPPKGVRAARWLPNGNGFVVEEEITNETKEGKATTLVARKWIMWPDGTLSIEIISEDPRGTAFNSKRVFVKK